ncbi:hypothetical protein HaLaN_07180, partial [Haematococcus lacustris]
MSAVDLLGRPHLRGGRDFLQYTLELAEAIGHNDGTIWRLLYIVTTRFLLFLISRPWNARVVRPASHHV